MDLNQTQESSESTISLNHHQRKSSSNSNLESSSSNGHENATSLQELRSRSTAERMLSVAKAFVNDSIQPGAPSSLIMAYFSHTRPVRMSHTPLDHPFAQWGHFNGLNSIRSYFDLHPLYLSHSTVLDAADNLTADVDSATVRGTYSCERWWIKTGKRFHEEGDYCVTFDLDNFKIVRLDIVNGPSSLLTAMESEYESTTPQDLCPMVSKSIFMKLPFSLLKLG